jgi:catechol 2,3-dioxygenase-like lactoylglutathione lyase family enzyme
MVPIRSVMHFSIAVSDMDRSVRFYTEVLGFRHLATTPTKHLSFLDAAGTCILLCKRNPPINSVLDDGHGFHHAFAVDEKHYRKAKEYIVSQDVEIIGEEDPAGYCIAGPRFYFRDPDGTVLEIINLTYYAGQTTDSAA